MQFTLSKSLVLVALAATLATAIPAPQVIDGIGDDPTDGNAGGSSFHRLL